MEDSASRSFCSAAGCCRRYRRFRHTVIAQVLQKAGWSMGNRVNPRNEDSPPLAWFLTKWLRRPQNFPKVDSPTLARARRYFEQMVYFHRNGISSPDARRG
jgi:hypothetical protein